MTTPTNSHKAWTDKGGHVTWSGGLKKALSRPSEKPMTASTAEEGDCHNWIELTGVCFRKKVVWLA